MSVPAHAASTTPSATPATAASPATESSPATANPATSAANGMSEETTAAVAQPTWQEAMLAADRDEALAALLDSTDSDRLIKQPKLAGLLGDLAEKRARSKESEIEKRITDRLEKKRLTELRDSDPFAHAEELRRMEAAATSAETENTATQATLAAWASEVNSEIFELARTLPKEAIQKLASKKYEGNLAQGLRAYVADVIDASKEHWLTSAQEAWKTDLMPTLLKEALAQVNGGEDDSLDTSTSTAPAGALTQAEWSANGREKSWRTANRARINEALSKGRIRPLD